jgi:LPS sulfotransferase NodH
LAETIDLDTLDFKPPVTPTRFYALCSTPRCGSTLVAHLLWRTGRMGAPGEYYNLHDVLFQMQNRFHATGIGDYTDQLLRRRTSPNGVFGVKLHHNHWQTFRHTGRFHLFSKMKYIRIRRRDRLAQAISYAIARQTRQWTADMPARNAAEYRFNDVLRAVQDLDRQDRDWSSLFAESKIQPLDIVYEEFSADSERHVAEICHFVGVDPREPAAPVPLPDLARQFSDINAQWMDRFRADNARRQEVSPQRNSQSAS